MLDFLGDLRRTHTCGALRASEAGSRAVLMGWVNRRRDLGNLIFIDVRDRTGMTQVVFDRERSPRLHDKAASLRSEFVIAVIGTVEQRDPDTVNHNIGTGEIEVVAEELLLLNESKNPPFLPSEPTLPNEEVRLKYRYIDLRRGAMQANIELRHKVALAIREYLASRGFLEIETPFLTRSTPEGARDFLVPSRVQPGSFYALPQSPQLFKQILMISGFDQYFQIVRCFRDEDLRADRQLEFTQVDLEMSFPQQERVFEVTEGFLKAAFAAAGVTIPTPFPRMTYGQAIRFYGSDKPDLRLPAMADVKQVFTAEMMKALDVEQQLPVVAIRIPKVGELSRKEREELRRLFWYYRFHSLLIDDLKRLDKTWPSSRTTIRARCGAAPDDLVVVVAGRCISDADWEQAEAQSEWEGIPIPHKDRTKRIPTQQREPKIYANAGAFRIALGSKYADRHKAFAGARSEAASYQFLWVTDFPMFEWDEDGRRWAAAHHPFTSPHEQDMDKLESDPASVRALAYDVVLNGTELGSGSIRIHRQDIQQKIFKALGMTPEEAQARFGFFLEALTYGTPPHGGIALGLDRIVMILAGADSLREVIPFPKTARAVDLMVDAPTPVSNQQLRELSIEVADGGRRQHLDLVASMQLAGRSFVDNVKTMLEEQRGTVPFDAYDATPDEVIAGLFGRLFRLLQVFVLDFHVWSDDLAKSVLRMMLESLIYLKFLVEQNKAELFLEFKKYGIGQEKLYKMQLRKLLEEGKLQDSSELREFIDSDSDEEIFDELANVRLGNFENLRELSEKAGLKEDYILHYQPYSVIAHGHWPALKRYHLQRCREPLHKLHVQPTFELPGFNFANIPVALRFFSDAYDLWTAKYNMEDRLLPELDRYVDEINQIFAKQE